MLEHDIDVLFKIKQDEIDIRKEIAIKEEEVIEYKG